jgi:plastocyanin
MRRLALLAPLWPVLLASPGVAAGRSVGISVFDFRPNTMTINPGDSVTWRWSGPDTNHSVTADSGQAESFDSDPGGAPGGINHEVGATFRHTFSKPGVYDYVCRVHPDFMRGLVVVRAVPDHEAPRIHSLRARPSRFCPGRTGGCRKAWARLRFTLSERARLSGQIRWIEPGRSPAPVRVVRFRGRKGRNEARVATRGLRPARYGLTLRAEDAVGNVSKPARTSFAVRRAR